MEDLIKALNILCKYTKSQYPLYCERDELHIVDIDINKVEKKDVEMLKELGFNWNPDVSTFYCAGTYFI